jgi:hypothetical protein
MALVVVQERQQPITLMPVAWLVAQEAVLAQVEHLAAVLADKATTEELAARQVIILAVAVAVLVALVPTVEPMREAMAVLVWQMALQAQASLVPAAVVVLDKVLPVLAVAEVVVPVHLVGQALLEPPTQVEAAALDQPLVATAVPVS